MLFDEVLFVEAKTPKLTNTKVANNNMEFFIIKVFKINTNKKLVVVVVLK